ncbi:Auxin-responsive protein SAUR71 [Linum perenne]
MDSNWAPREANKTQWLGQKWAGPITDRPSDNIPADVKEEHFVVYAVNDAEPRRFVIRLDYLAHPGFVKILELVAEEFGLRQAGVLAVPCRSVDLRRILGSGRSL